MADKQTIRLAISTCPNDTFAFHAILNRLVDCHGLEFQIQLLDIQQLNEGWIREEFDFAKASFHLAAILADKTFVLPSGSALGFGVGPLLLARDQETSPSKSTGLTLCPGRHTTAMMLFRMFYGAKPQVQQALFSEIMPRLSEGTADFGVCIHEGRFTWQKQGLARVEDLGSRWESETSTPLPLGGILARRDLDRETISKVQSTIRESIEYGLAHPKSTIPTMQKHAQEFDEDVLFKHVALYVNRWTVDLGDEGEKALRQLSGKAREAGLTNNASNIEIWR